MFGTVNWAKAGWATRMLLAAQEAGNGLNPELCLLTLGSRFSCFLDIGANRGIYSKVAQALYDKVYVFEPIPSLSRRLHESLSIKCDIRSIALSSYDGTATFNIPIVDGAMNTELASLRGDLDGASVEEITVSVSRLDSLGISDVSFIKIDVEGTEFDVLSGAEQTLARDTPILIVEIEDRHTRGNTKRVFSALAGLGYRPYVFDRSQLIPRTRSHFKQIGWGLSYLLQLRRPRLMSIGQALHYIYRMDRELNTSIFPYYVNNFIFIHKKTSTGRYDVVELRVGDLPPPPHHWMARQLASAGLIDTDWYLSNNVDVAKAGMDPALHYVTHGAAEGRDPSERFSTKTYLDRHAGHMTPGENPLWHYFNSLEDRAAPGGSDRQASEPKTA